MTGGNSQLRALNEANRRARAAREALEATDSALVAARERAERAEHALARHLADRDRLVDTAVGEALAAVVGDLASRDEDLRVLRRQVRWITNYLHGGLAHGLAADDCRDALDELAAIEREERAHRA